MIDRDARWQDVGRFIREQRESAHEAELSARRRTLHERIDVLQAEITRRYKTGEASVESLLR